MLEITHIFLLPTQTIQLCNTLPKTPQDKSCGCWNRWKTNWQKLPVILVLMLQHRCLALPALQPLIEFCSFTPDRTMVTVTFKQSWLCPISLFISYPDNSHVIGLPSITAWVENPMNISLTYCCNSGQIRDPFASMNQKRFPVFALLCQISWYTGTFYQLRNTCIWNNKLKTTVFNCAGQVLRNVSSRHHVYCQNEAYLS